MSVEKTNRSYHKYKDNNTSIIIDKLDSNSINHNSINNIENILSNKNNVIKDTCEKCSLNKYYITKSITTIDEFVKILIHKCNSLIYNTSLFNESVLNSDYIHSQRLYNLDIFDVPFKIKNSLKLLFKNIKLLGDKFEYIYKKNSNKNKFIEVFKYKTFDFQNNESTFLNINNSTYIDLNSSILERSSKSYDNAIYNFNKSKETFENMLKDLKSTILESNIYYTNITQNSTEPMSSNTNSLSVITKNKLSANNNKINIKDDFYPSLINYENIINNQHINELLHSNTNNYLYNLNVVLNSLSKENTCLKIELKLLYDTLSKNKGIEQILVVENKELDKNYFCKLKDDKMKEYVLLDIKNFLIYLRKSEFFIN